MNENQKNQSDIGVVGLAVMGQNLILNMNDNGYVVTAYNRTTSKVDEFIANEAKDTNVVGVHSLEELVSSLKSPRKIMLMIKAGDAVDQEIDKLIPLLEKGDIIIDGGNSLYTDTSRREKYVSSKGLLYVGTGVSGGEEGARHGPSIMPGGSPEAWPYVKDIFQKISAKVDNDVPCCDWVGQGGAGHYVKMVHNGIEYGDMQLICEAYDLLKKYAGLSNDRIAQIFDEWNKGELDSYLIEITADILAFKENDESLIDKIMDTAGQKGTGKWTVVDSAQLGQPVTLISEAVFARCLSSIKDERVAASAILQGPSSKLENNAEEFIESVRQALYAAKIVSYAQGYMLMRAAAKEYGWDLNYGGIALMWRGGCIIRSRFLGKIKEAYETNPALTNLLIDPFFVQELTTSQDSLRKTVATAALAGIPLPAMSSALSFYDGYRSAKLPASLLQAQRDYFGAHTYERIDTPKGEMHHTNWTGQGGTTSSGSYNV
ncbi:MAG: decarboxylating NADP(+)-dependent phosphogluconate dehydrogenase [bacterium]